MNHSELLCDFTAIKRLRTDDIEVPDEVALDLLQDIIMLYVWAWAFAFAKDIKINHNMNKNKSRATKSLRAEIKNVSANLDQGHWQKYITCYFHYKNLYIIIIFYLLVLRKYDVTKRHICSYIELFIIMLKQPVYLICLFSPEIILSRTKNLTVKQSETN